MASAVHGRAGAVSVGATPTAVASVTGFSYEESAEETETTAMGDTAKSYLGGLRDGSGTIDCNWLATDAGHTALLAGLASGEETTIALYPEGNVATKVEYTGAVVINSTSLASSKDDLVTLSFSFRGFLTKATISA